MAFGQLRVPISDVRSSSYAGSSSRILTDPTGERRNRQFRQRFRGLRSYRSNPSGESGLIENTVRRLASQGDNSLLCLYHGAPLASPSTHLLTRSLGHAGV